jgi:precorrin-6B C5,15-methyltransferase / cobalt-precorrin-6B C5,C15-methyltransferase
MRAVARAAAAGPAEPWLSVIGIGDDGLASLSPAARALLAAGEVLVGGARHLAMVPDHPAERLTWRSPLEATLADLAARRGRRVVVLASGDPLCFGVGELLARHFAVDELRVLPAPSVISLVCARLAWSRVEVEALSLHGRPAELLNRHLAPGARLIALSNDGTTPDRIAAMLAAQGWGPSRLWVFEHLGGEGERCSEGLAASWQPARFAALNTVAIECRAGAGATLRARIPGLPDDAFRSDGMLTKREVRAATLARLMPLPGQCLWDVGAGSGAIAIEWLRAIAGGRAIAIESVAARCALIGENAAALGTPELEIVQGAAPAALAGLPVPDAVFVGGGSRVPGLLDFCWQALAAGGRLVANVVTVEGERALLDWQARHGGELVRIEVARLDAVGSLHAWRPAMAVTQLAACKP